MAFGVKANVRAPHRYLRMGALCWVQLLNNGWGNDRLYVRGMSRGGRMVTTWVDARDLTNWRAAWFQGTDKVFDNSPFRDRDEAVAFAASMQERYGEESVRPHAAGFGSQ